MDASEMSEDFQARRGNPVEFIQTAVNAKQADIPKIRSSGFHIREFDQNGSSHCRES
jgi:hypothetical protein